MANIRRCFRALLLLVLPTTVAVAQTPRSWGPPNGSLLIIGGGAPTQDIFAIAARLAGGTAARWVVIPTAAEDSAIDHLRHSNFAATLGQQFTVLHTRDRAEADSEPFTAPLRSATAVWFVGGRQWRLVDAYAGTRTEREIRTILDRGGLIAGTSAGATIQGSYLVRGAVQGNRILIAPGHERGFGYLGNAAIDQHIIARGRENDMTQIVAVHPELLGIGIDEGTALLVRRNTATVLGRSIVMITTAIAPPYTLSAGDRFDLATWTPLPPAR
jgi:cyanophycinase